MTAVQPRQPGVLSLVAGGGEAGRSWCGLLQLLEPLRSSEVGVYMKAKLGSRRFAMV